ncbi:M23 family metallopeptidase [Hymenobacter algoricola]|uniref:M23ase beta-sheet core domain-containing protein n=1 Tax=Hymenobacter algoricola TaxID=486267 RepID=A0ABP7MBW1_9BACT
MLLFLFWAGRLAAALLPAAFLSGPGPVSVTVAPTRVFLEERAGSHLNFDFAVQAGPDSLWLAKVEVSVYDQAGALVVRKFVDNNGFSPAVSSLSHRVFAPGQTALVFNPFHFFAPDVEVARLAYTFEFQDARRRKVTQQLDVRPERYQPRAALKIPVSGRLLVWDGHDENAHHRRLDYLHPVARQVGIRTNFMRYAHDFVVVNEKGETHSGEGRKNTDYPGFDQPVHAPAAGRVVAAYSAQPDNDNGQDYFDPRAMVGKDPLLLYGNYVVLDHGNGEFSLLGHLRQNSVVVKVGDQVRADQVVARLGSSGSSYFPHLHYELRTGATMNVEGLPAYFTRFELVRGSRRRTVRTGAVDSGDLLVQPRR